MCARISNPTLSPLRSSIFPVLLQRWREHQSSSSIRGRTMHTSHLGEKHYVARVVSRCLCRSSRISRACRLLPLPTHLQILHTLQLSAFLLLLLLLRTSYERCTFFFYFCFSIQSSTESTCTSTLGAQQPSFCSVRYDHL